MKISRFIPEWRVKHLTKTIERINKKAVKYNLPPFILAFTGEEKIKELTFPGFDGGEDYQAKVKFFEATLEGEEIKLDGWTFVAAIDHEASYNIVHNISNEPLDKDYSNQPANCDHCHHNRLRKKTYIVKNITSGEFKQVGSTCVNDFVGHGDVERWLNLYSEIYYETTRSNEDYEGFDKFYSYYETSYYVLLSAQSILNAGFCPKSGDDPTTYHVSSVYWNVGLKLEISKEAEKITKYVFETYLPQLKEKEDPNDYERNIINLLSEEVFGIKYDGYVASAVWGAIKQKRREEEVKSNYENPNNFIGNVGDKMISSLKLISSTGFETMYGYSIRYFFKDTDGNNFIWFTSAGTQIELEDEKTYMLKFKIKKQETWKNMNQNVISYVKIAS